MRFKNYINRYNKKNRIYSEEELLAMTLNELLNNESLIMAQDSDIGIPSYEELRKSPNTRWIDSFINKDGQKDGGFFGSILENDFGDYTKPKQNVFDSIKPFAEQYPEPIIKEDKVPTRIIYENEEETPYILEGGVEENVYKEPEEDEEDIQEYPSHEPSESEPKTTQDNNFDIEELLESILKNNSSEEDELLPMPEIPDNTMPYSENDFTFQEYVKNIPALQNNEELKEIFNKLVEELKKKYKRGRLNRNNFNGYTGGANSIQGNYEEKIKPSKKEYIQGMLNDYKSLKDPVNTALYVLGEFFTNYENMKDANTHGADKYFHAKANYEASQQGIVGDTVAKLISDIREFTDSYRNIHEKGYTPEFSKKDSEEDQKANQEGRRLGRKYPIQPPYKVLEHFKPKGLPERYQKHW